MTVATKTPIKQSWNVEKIQAEAVGSMTRHMMTTFQVIEKLGPEAQKQFHQAMTQMKVEHFKKLGVKTPIDLVKAFAEFEVNVFGSKIVVWGDDKEASMEYEQCACWESMQKVMPMNEQKKQEMGKCWSEQINAIAKAFDFSKAEMTFPTEKTSIVTYTK
jgi:homoserine trans-succinylase